MSLKLCAFMVSILLALVMSGPSAFHILGLFSIDPRGGDKGIMNNFTVTRPHHLDGFRRSNTTSPRVSRGSKPMVLWRPLLKKKKEQRNRFRIRPKVCMCEPLPLYESVLIYKGTTLHPQLTVVLARRPTYVVPFTVWARILD